MSVAFGTVVAKNYAAFARVLADRLHRFHPEIECFVALADEVDGVFDPIEERFTLVELDEMAIPDPQAFRFRYSHPVLAVAAKPFLLGHLLDRGFTSAVFLDADIFVLARLDALLAAVAGHAVTLTPHLLEPPVGDDRIQRELEILVAGSFNAGVVGVTEGAGTRAFLRWWQDRVWHRCDHDDGGAYFDQRWLDLAPSFVEDLHVLRDAGVNVAHWNLPERSLAVDGDTVSVGGQPCRLLHCSGFDPDQTRHLTRHGRRPQLRNVGAAAAVLLRYRSLLDQAGFAETRTWPYAFDRFTNGVPIADAARELYRSLGDAASSFGDPFDAGRPEGFYAWMTAPATPGDTTGSAVARLWRDMWERRPDLRHAYPEPASADHPGFVAWLRTSAGPEHGVPPELLPGPGRPIR